MTRTELVIGVKDVRHSSRWYQSLLDCRGNHEGNVFEILTNDAGEHILSLHKWEAHGHPTLSNPEPAAGNGLILYFVVRDIIRIRENARKLNAKLEEELHVNSNSGREEFSIRDPDNYYISVCTTTESGDARVL